MRKVLFVHRQQRIVLGAFRVPYTQQRSLPERRCETGRTDQNFNIIHAPVYHDETRQQQQHHEPRHYLPRERFAGSAGTLVVRRRPKRNGRRTTLLRLGSVIVRQLFVSAPCFWRSQATHLKCPCSKRLFESKLLGAGREVGGQVTAAAIK